MPDISCKMFTKITEKCLQNELQNQWKRPYDFGLKKWPEFVPKMEPKRDRKGAKWDPEWAHLHSKKNNEKQTLQPTPLTTI